MVRRLLLVRKPAGSEAEKRGGGGGQHIPAPGRGLGHSQETSFTNQKIKQKKVKKVKGKKKKEALCVSEKLL